MVQPWLPAQIPARCCRSRPPLFTGLIPFIVVMCFEQVFLCFIESKVVTSAGFIPLIYVFTSCAFYKWLLFKKMLVLVLTWVRRWYRRENWRAMVWSLTGARNFLASYIIQSGSGAHTAPYPVDSVRCWMGLQWPEHCRLVPKLKISKRCFHSAISFTVLDL